MLRTIFCLPLLIAFIPGCILTSIDAKVPDEEKGLVSASFAMTKLDEEPKGYGLYTYVIYGVKLGEHGESTPDISSSRLESLLEAIYLSTNSSDTLDKSNIPDVETNLFCIPVKAAKKPANLENYNSSLALLYRDIAIGALKSEVAFQNKFATNAGPFLVSTLQPLNQVRTPQPVLFSDLSYTNPSAMKELVAAYKQKVGEGVTANDPQVFDPLKIRILSLILDADKNIKLIKNAVATPNK